MEQLKGISIFVEAVEAGGFSAAAERLHLTRSAVGKTIARLEQRLGVRLFNRTTRMQSLTEEGRFFYERCLRAVEEIRLGKPCWNPAGVTCAADCASQCPCFSAATASRRSSHVCSMNIRTSNSTFPSTTASSTCSKMASILSSATGR